MFAALLTAVLLAEPEAAPPPERGQVLYRTTLLRAAPGRLLEAIAELKTAAGALVLRHSQGDQWDLMVLRPLLSYVDHLARAEALRPLVDPSLVAFQEDTFARGPDLGLLPGFAQARLYHVEMFRALPGKQQELIRQREMENAYLRALQQPTNAIFIRELGGAWDAFTVGAYAGWKHFAEREDIPPARAEAAARAAGFEGDDRIGPYLRSLIQSHHDTLATPVR